MIARWAAIPGFPGYEISEGAEVRNSEGRVLRPDASHERYLYVRLTKNGRKFKKGLHVLMLEAFVGPANGRWALHRNDVPTDNKLANLYWGTPKQNTQDRAANGRSPRGERSVNALLTKELCAWVIESPQSSLKLAPILGVAPSTVRAVRSGQNWSGALNEQQPEERP